MKDNAAAFAALQVQIERLNKLTNVVADVAPEVAIVVREEIEAQIARGQAPDGTPWELTAAGKVPLRRAAASLTVKALGSRIVATLQGPAALHHKGAAKGRIRRQVLPSRTLPDAFIAAIKRVVESHLLRRLKGK